LIRRYYSGVFDGFEIPTDEEKAIRTSKGDPCYGEITPAAVRDLAAYMDLGPSDVFYDLGSGTGKVINQLALTAPAKRLVGIELSRSRVRAARSVLRRLRRENELPARRVVFRHENILNANLDDATVIYTCSTAFSWRFLRAICRKVRDLPRRPLLISLQELENDTYEFEEIDVLRLDVTWQRRDKVYVYRNRRPPR